MPQPDAPVGPDHPKWTDWRWQMQNRVHSVEALERWTGLDAPVEAMNAALRERL